MSRPTLDFLRYLLLLLQDMDDSLGRRQVWIADAERDHVDAGPHLLLDLAIDLGKEIRRDLAQPARARPLAPWH